MAEMLLEIKNLKKHFPVKEGFLKKRHQYIYAVDGVTFVLQKGETFGLVGESGCGKSTLARLILRLIEPTSGEIFYRGRNICLLTKEELRQIRRELQIIFQDPFASLNPRMTIEQIVGQALEIHHIARGIEKREIVADLLDKVGVGSEHMLRYPHEFSGGQRQRIGIARALALRPRLVIGDEPVSALDVSIRAQVLNLLENLKVEFDLSYMIISHDLSVIKHISDRVGVMYLGKLVEMAESAELYDNPFHPYTQALLLAAPIPDPEIKKKRIVLLQGDVPSPMHPPSGCRFHTRCSERMGICEKNEPELRELRERHLVACHLT